MNNATNTTQYRVTDIKSGDSQITDIDNAARIAMLDTDDIEWAIDEEGECTTDEHRITAVDRSQTAPVTLNLDQMKAILDGMESWIEGIEEEYSDVDAEEQARMDVQHTIAMQAYEAMCAAYSEATAE